MSQFLKYFVLEFVIIFIVGSAGYWLLGVAFNLTQLLFSSVTAGAIIAFALTQTFKKPGGL